MKEALTKRLLEVSTNCGADLFGVADVGDFSGYAGKRNPFFYDDNARSVIVIGYHISDPILDVWLKSVDGKRSHSFVNEVLGNIALEIISVLLKEGKKAVLSPLAAFLPKMQQPWRIWE